MNAMTAPSFTRMAELIRAGRDDEAEREFNALTMNFLAETLGERNRQISCAINSALRREQKCAGRWLIAQPRHLFRRLERA